MKKRVLSFILVLCMVITLMPAAAIADMTRVNETVYSYKYINPEYADVLNENDLLKPKQNATVKSLSDRESVCASTLEEAAAVVRDAAKQRNTTIKVCCLPCDIPVEDLPTQIWSKAVEHTGNPKEGDYIQKSFGGWECSMRISTADGLQYAYLEYTVTYFTTSAQEAKMDAEVDALLAKLKLTGKNEYEKIKGIYDYICENVVYDYTNLEDEAYNLKYTAYAALIERTAVCQGYALLFYRLALELGVDARIVSGYSNGGSHSWIIAGLGGKYYNIDPTWDAANRQCGVGYSWFLKCNSNFYDHARDDEFTTDEFNSAYPMALDDYSTDYDHNFGEWTVIKQPTCTEKGEKTRYCAHCDAAQTQEIAAKGHDFNAVVTAPDCTKDGYTTYSCINCGDSYTDNAVAATGHNYVDGVCVNCGAYEPAAPTDIIANGYCDKYRNLNWKLCADGVLTISGNGNMADFTSSVHPAWYPYRDIIKRVIIEDGVTGIGTWAFYDLYELSCVEIAESVKTIGWSVFYDCTGLESIDIPDGVSVINANTFTNCSSLKSVEFPDSLIEIKKEAFLNCTLLTELFFPESFSIIGENAFADCINVSKVSIPSGLTTVGSDPFGINRIFTNCPVLEEVEFRGTYDELRSREAQWRAKDFCIADVIKCSDGVLPCNDTVDYGKTGDVDYRISRDGTITISGQGRMEQLIPVAMDKLTGDAFRPLLRIAVIEEGVLDIGLCTFYLCNNLVCAYIPNSVDNLYGAFFECPNLANVYYSGTEEEWQALLYKNDGRDQSGITAAATIHFHEHNFTEWEKDRDTSCSEEGLFIRKCTECSKVDKRFIDRLPHTLIRLNEKNVSCTEDGYSGDLYCTVCNQIVKEGRITFASHIYYNGKCIECGATVPELTGEIIASSEAGAGITWKIDENGVLRIEAKGELPRYKPGEPAPWHAYKDLITTVEIMPGLEIISEYAFYDLPNLKEISIPQSVYDIYGDAFNRCSSLVRVCLPYNITVISSGTFEDCASLNEVIIPPYTIIRSEAFKGCTEISQIYYGGSEEEWSSYHNEYDGISDIGLTVHYNYEQPHYHEYSIITHAPTCTEKGYTTYTCRLCKDSYVTDYVDALDHDYGEWKVTKAPTCTEKGVETCYCSRCDATETRKVDALGHDLVHHEGKAASCTETGWEAYDTCSRCDYTTYKEIHGAGHNYTAVVTAATCTEKGCTTHTCTCGDSYIDSYVDALGHDYKDGLCTRCGAENPDYKPPVQENPFVDVSETAVYYDAVIWASTEDITSGYGNNDFRPQNPCTRAQVVTFLWRAMGSPEPTTTDNPFSDVSEKQSNGKDNPYYKAILWAAEKGITTGYDGGLFKPNDTVTRGQFVTFLWRAEGKPATVGSINGFADAAKISAPFQQAVAWAVEKGITTGYNDNTFRPNDACTRWAVVLFMFRDMA